jgi:hypothetical protein
LLGVPEGRDGLEDQGGGDGSLVPNNLNKCATSLITIFAGIAIYDANLTWEYFSRAMEDFKYKFSEHALPCSTKGLE